MSKFLVLPNHLFKDIKELKKYKEVYLYECKDYFTNCNKIKIAYMRASMKYYESFLIENEINVKYINYDKDINYNDYFMYNPYNKNIKCKNIIKDTDLFLFKIKDLDEYHSLHKNKRMLNASFYNFAKKKLKILENEKSYDTSNRLKYPGINIKNKTYSNEFINEAIIYTNKYFSNNLGEVENVKYYPTTHSESIIQLKYFLKEKFNNFGNYQDALAKEEDNVFLYHSVISCCLNNGLLSPVDVIKYVKKYKNKVAINNYEGFLRQIISWREYMCYIYLYYDDSVITRKFTNKIPSTWYSANTGIYILDNEIKKCIRYAYSHHIIRLMVFLNLLVLNKINHDDIILWFTNVCSIDAYPWVMWSNIISMGYFTNRFTRKPYISTDNYIVNMSNYKKETNDTWRNLYIKNKPIH